MSSKITSHLQFRDLAVNTRPEDSESSIKTNSVSSHSTLEAGSSGLRKAEWIAYSSTGHSSSITKTQNGFVVITNGWLKKTDARSILLIQGTPDGKWMDAKLLNAPGEFSDDPKAFSTSPILCKVDPFDETSQEYLLFFRVGTGYETKLMQSLAFRSQDGCATFTRETLPAQIVGPTKCKPLYFGNYLVFGSSVEIGDPSNKDGQSSASARIEIYDVRDGKWYQSPELIGSEAFGAIEPTFCKFEKEEISYIRMFCRNRSKGFALCAEFTLPDDPKNIIWPSKLVSSTLPNCDSGLDLIDLAGKTVGGRVVDRAAVVAFGNFLGTRNSLEMVVSSDAGQTWSKPFAIDSGEFPSSYFDDTTGLIHVTYASTKTNLPYAKENQTIRHLEIDPARISFNGQNPWLLNAKL